MIGVRISDIEIYTDAVVSAVKDGEQRSLRIVGFAVRADAMASIVPGVARPGQPPRERTGDLRRNINYGVTDGELVVGPRLLPKRSQDVMPALESGGISFDVNGRKHYIQRHPFMVPALNRVARRLLPGVFKDIVKG